MRTDAPNAKRNQSYHRIAIACLRGRAARCRRTSLHHPYRFPIPERFARGCKVDGWGGVHLLPADLFREMREEVANGFVLKNLRVHPAYGFPVEASIDSDKLEDQEWGFRISDFKLTARPNSGT